jgi:hypothetical protein
MAIFTKPENLNGAELKQELAAIGIVVESIKDNLDGTISFNTDNEKLAKPIVDAHNGTVIPTEPTITEKLASVGLSIDDLKVALGL